MTVPLATHDRFDIVALGEPRVASVSALGDDAYGTALRELWTREGVDHASVAADASACPAICFVTHRARPASRAAPTPIRA